MPAGAVLSTTRGLVHEIWARLGLCSPGCLRAPPPSWTCLGLAWPASVATNPQFPSSAEPPDNHPTRSGLGLTLWGNLGDPPLPATHPSPPGLWPGPASIGQLWGVGGPQPIASYPPWLAWCQYVSYSGCPDGCSAAQSFGRFVCYTFIIIDVLPQLLLSMCHR